MTLREVLDVYSQAQKDLDAAKSDLRHVLHYTGTNEVLEATDDGLYVMTVARLQQEVRSRKDIIARLEELELDVEFSIEPYEQMQW